MDEIFTRQELRAMTTGFASVATALTGKLVRVFHINGKDLAYTDGRDIYINFEHVYAEGMTKTEKILFAKGLFSHELAHMLMTDFSSERLNNAKRPQYEREVAHDIFNVVEDAAIEFFLPNYLAEDYIRALDFCRGVTYSRSPQIDDPMNDGSPRPPFAQFMTAAIQYGDFGMLKGRFTDETAEEIFVKCLPHYDSAIENPVPYERILYADEITELTRPLWEADAKAEEEMRKMLEEILDSFAKNQSKGSGSGSPSDGLPEQPETASERTKRRNITFRRVSREEFEEAKKNGGSGPIPEDADIEVLIPDEPIEEDEDAGDGNENSVPIGGAGKNSEEAEHDEGGAGGDGEEESDGSDTDGTQEGGGKASENAGDKDDGSSSSGGADGKDAADDANDGDDNDGASASSKSASSEGESSDGSSDGADGSDTSESPSSNPQSPSGKSSAKGSKNDPSGHNKDGVPDDVPGGGVGGGALDEEPGEPDEDFVLSEEDIAAVEALLSTEVEENEEPSALPPPPDFEVSGGYENVCKKVRAQNIWVKCDATETAKQTYKKIVAEQATGIANLTSQLKRILKNRQEEAMYKQSGRISAKRLNCGRRTSRVFTKKRYPDGADIAVTIAVDISGSMASNGKYVNAMRTAIALAEVFGTLKIPVYIFGFTADQAGYKANHYHYIEWKNRPIDRLRLLQVSALSNNFDGYSIRYATELLKKRDEEKKLLFVISDGQPAASAYHSSNGIWDVKMAVEESNRVATTIGILLGDANPEVHRAMYGYNFIHCTNPKELLPKMGGLLKRYI